MPRRRLQGGCLIPRGARFTSVFFVDLIVRVCSYACVTAVLQAQSASKTKGKLMNDNGLAITVKITGMCQYIPNKDPNKKGRILFLGGQLFVGNPGKIEPGVYQEVVVSGAFWGDRGIQATDLLEAREKPASADNFSVIPGKGKERAAG